MERALFEYNPANFIYVAVEERRVVARIRDLCASLNILNQRTTIGARDCRFQLPWICEKAATVLQLEKDPQPPAVSSLGMKYTRRSSAASLALGQEGGS